MKKSLLVVCALISLLICAGSLPAVAATLWYNGDYVDGMTGLANENNTSISQASVYDNFIVPSGTWNINTVWSNNLMDTTASLASWEIRSGVSVGNGGTLLASGIAAATQTPTGRVDTLASLFEYTIQVTGLNVNLGPGTYWLNVTPIDSGTGRSFNSITSGLNAIGLPAGNDGNSFFDSTFFGPTVFGSTFDNLLFDADFSMGVAGSANAVPLPPSLLLLGSGLAGLVGWRRFRKI